MLFLSACGQPQESNKIPIKVMSYNIKNAYGGTTLKPIAEVINNVEPDYVALQEADSVTSRVNGLNELFISTHWMNGDSISRLESAIIINAYIDSIIKAGVVSENWPFLLLGDLNARDGSKPINEMRDHWETSNFNYGIDWLFFRPANRWKWISSKKLSDPEEKLSDHEAVVSDIELLDANLE